MSGENGPPGETNTMPATNPKLTVLVISLAIVVVVLFVIARPVIHFAREAARRKATVNNLKQLKAALAAYDTSVSESATATATTETINLPFDTYSGYFVSNKFEPDAAESFVVISDQERFDEVFGVAMVMDDKSHRLPEDAFKSNIVLAAIKRGGEVWEFKVEGVTIKDNVVELRYTTTSSKSDSATFSSPLIVSIPNGKYNAVQFIENGKAVKPLMPLSGKRLWPPGIERLPHLTRRKLELKPPQAESDRATH